MWRLNLFPPAGTISFSLCIKAKPMLPNLTIQESVCLCCTVDWLNTTERVVVKKT